MNLGLKQKIVALTLISSLLPVITFTIISFIQKGFAEDATVEKMEELKFANIDQIAKDVTYMLESANDLIQMRINNDLEVARDVVKRKGSINIGTSSESWEITNQFTKKTTKVSIPKMYVGTSWLGKNKKMDRNTPVVDEVQKLVGGTCTIFQKVNKEGDMLRVATNVEKLDGTRAIGTYIPAKNPDGTANKVVSTVLSGKTFRGRAYVVNAWYLTAYEPIFDGKGEVIGMLYVGVKNEEIGTIRESIMKIVVGKTGYVFVLGGKGEQKGDYIISKGGTRDGENILGAKDANGVEFIREICNKAVKLKGGEVAYQTYPWLNKGDTEPREKISAIAYFEPWDWVIGAGTYQDDFLEAKDAISTSILYLILWGVVSGLAVMVIVLIFTMKISIRDFLVPILALTDSAKKIAKGDLTKKIDYQNEDEIGELVNQFGIMISSQKEKAEQAVQISEGNMNVEISIGCDEDILGYSIQKVKDNLASLTTDINDIIVHAVDGKLDYRGDSTKYSGEYSNIILGINDVLDNLIKPLNVTAEYVDRISKGDIPPKIEEAYKGDFNEIKNNLNQLIDIVNSVTKDTDTLLDSALNGQLDYRADSSQYVGDWTKLVNGINLLIDAFVKPINVTADYVDKISKGDIPEKITEEYKGGFNEIKDNLNQCIDAVNLLIREAKELATNARVGNITFRGDTSMHKGDYAKIINGVNGALDSITGILDDMPIPVMGIDKEKNILFMNKIGCQLGETEFSILKGTKCHDYFNTSHCHSGECACELAMSRETLVTQETDAHPGSLNLDISYSGFPIFDENGEVVGAFEGVVDQTEVKKQMNIQKKIGQYQAYEAEKLAIALIQLSEGILKLDLIPETPDEDTKNVSDVFKSIYTSVQGVIDTFKKLDDNLSELVKMQKDGDIEFRANPTILKGAYSEILTGINDLCDAIINPVVEGLGILSEYGEGDFEKDMRKLPGKQIIMTNTFNQIKTNLIELIGDINNIAKSASDGNLNTRADIDKHKGEYQNIVIGINGLVDEISKPLNEAGQVLSEMSAGDLTASMQGSYKGDFSTLKSNINLLSDSLNTLLDQVSQTVENTSSAAVEISSTADTMAAASAEQSAQADEVASAVEEMSRTVTQNAMSATQTAQTAQQNGEIAQEGGIVVKQTVEKMKDIAEVVNSTAQNIEKLGESSKEIGEIISVIDDIADQTNLLALNAAIEAARAGEQGRGFAVVADEVRKLAERTTEATQKIATMIKGIQTETEQAVAEMQKGNVEVNNGIELADKAGNSLEQVVTSSQELLDMINQIAAASEQQSSTSEEIAKNVSSISEVTSDSARRVQDIASSSDELAKLTEHLTGLMSKFKIFQNDSIESKRNQFEDEEYPHRQLEG